MSKILKRTLTLALICCMLLSVMAPLASAEDPAEPYKVTYNFQKAASVTAQTLYSSDETAANKSPAIVKDANGDVSWYLLKSTHTACKLDSTHGIYNYDRTNNNQWLAVSIIVPVSGTYCVSATLTSGNNNWSDQAEIYFMEADAEFSTGVTNKQRVANVNHGNTSFSNGLNQKKYTVNFRNVIGLTGNGSVRSMEAYMGNMYLNAGEYIIVLRETDDHQGYSAIRALTIDPATDATPFVSRFNDTEQYGSVSEVSTSQFMLLANASAPGLAVSLYNENLNMNGFDLTIKSLWSCQTLNQSKAGFYDATGTSLLNVLEGTPVFPASKETNNHVLQANLPLYDAAAGGYKLVKPTTKFTLKEGQTDIIENTEEGTAKFVFKVTLPQEAYALVQNTKAPLKVTADWTLNGVEQDTISFENFMGAFAQDTAGENVFFVTLAGFDKVEEETTVTVTPMVSVGTSNIVLKTFEYNYTPAA